MGTAQTIINWKDYGGEEDVFFEIYFSTSKPNKDISLDWQIQGDDGAIKREIQESRNDDCVLLLSAPLTFKEFKEMLIHSGVPTVVNNLKERIARLKKEKPNINPAKISDQLLVTSLNVLSRFEGNNLIWTRRENNGEK